MDSLFGMMSLFYLFRLGGLAYDMFASFLTAFKVKIKSIVEEGDFITYVANVEDPFKRGKSISYKNFLKWSKKYIFTIVWYV